MPVRALTLFESGPSAAGSTAARLRRAWPTARAEVMGIDLSSAYAQGHDGPDTLIPFRYALDLRCLRDLRRAVTAFRPEVVHAFGPLAVRVSAVLRPRRLVVSHADRAADPFTRWRLRRADAILVHSFAEGKRYEAAGVERSRWVELIPDVEPPDPADRGSIRSAFDIPPGTPLLIASGQFDANAGLRFAVWAFDIVRHVYPSVRLILIGDGPQRPRLERFADSLGCRDRVTFVGRRTDAARIVAAADIVWLTHREGGLTVAYEALAAGVRVLGFGTPDAVGLPVSATSFVPYADPAALAVATCRDLESLGPSVPPPNRTGAMAATVADVYDRLASR
jgi:glycosyltransferase involved in cell wall biosynthesis